MFKHIVVPLDGSTLSETALAYVVPLAKRMDAKIVLLHATADPYADMFDSDALRESAEQARQATHDYLRGVAERIRSNGIRCETRTDHGAPAAVILDYAAEQQPDLIAMSTHGRSGLRRLVVGSVTTTILPRAQTPLLVMHPGEDEQPRDYENSLESLIVPLDMSERSEAVLPHATALAHALDLSATLLTCIPSPSQLYIGSAPEMSLYPADLAQQAQESAAEYLEQTSEAVSKQYGAQVNAQALQGSPAAKIVEYAETQPNSLIIMCTQGRTGLGRMVLGSITDAVIRAGAIPVLVIPSHDAEAPTAEPAFAV